MTTKQELIDFIETRNSGSCIELYNDDADILIQMIKDLKPKVKKIKFIGGWFNENYVIYKKDDGHKVVRCSCTMGGHIHEIMLGKFATIQESIKACQEHHEEFILGELEE